MLLDAAGSPGRPMKHVVSDEQMPVLSSASQKRQDWPRRFCKEREGAAQGSERVSWTAESCVSQRKHPTAEGSTTNLASAANHARSPNTGRRRQRQPLASAVARVVTEPSAQCKPEQYKQRPYTGSHNGHLREAGLQQRAAQAKAPACIASRLEASSSKSADGRCSFYESLLSEPDKSNEHTQPCFKILWKFELFS